MKVIMQLGLVVSVFVLSQPIFAQNNILRNADFETGLLSPWFVGRSFTVSEDWNVTSAVVHTGAFSATVNGNQEIRQNFNPIHTEAIKEVSLWIMQPRTIGIGGAAIEFHYQDGFSGFDNFFFPFDTWNRIELTDRLLPNRLLRGFTVWGYEVGGQPGRTFLDDVRIQAVPEVIPPWFLAAGMATGCLVFGRRRKLV